MSLFIKVCSVKEVHMIYLMDMNYDDWVIKFIIMPQLENIGIYMHFCQLTAILEWNNLIGNC